MADYRPHLLRASSYVKRKNGFCIAGHDAPNLGGDGFDAADIWQAHPEISNVFFTTHAYLGEDDDDPKIVAFCRAFTQAYPGAIPDAFAALGYDAANLLITAIPHAGSTEPEAVRNALAGIRRFGFRCPHVYIS